MTRTTLITTVAALALTAAGPVLADTQLAANAGLTASEAEAMSLTEIAQSKFNQGVSRSDQQAVAIQPGNGGDRSQLAARAGMSPDASLTELTVAKYNAETRRDDRQGIAPGAGVTVISRSYGVASPARAQFVANAGLTADEAEGLTLTEIAQYKFNQGVSHADTQRVTK